jgi:thiamine biosynthesis lipoprotein
VLVSLILLVTLVGCSKPAAPASDWSEKEQLLYFGIPVRVLFTPANPELEAEVWAYLDSVDTVFNDYREDSEVGKINAASESLAVSTAFADAFALSTTLHEQTDKAFSISVRPLRRLWKSAAESGEVPNDEAVAAAWEQSTFAGNQIKEDKLQKANDNTQFDFGGIIKGIAADEVISRLRAGGATAALIQIGGETAAFGTSKRGKPHAIGIQHPTEMTNIWQAVVDPGAGMSCATSGNYRQPIMIGDTAFYHVFDPRTGRPVDTSTLSVSVMFPATGKNGLADALSTAGAVLGPKRTFEIVTEMGGEAMFLMRDGDQIKELATPGWKRFVRK